ncbi:MAG: DUF3179 domain-containing protein [bacterium]|nr:DUF3179 domain-containing protein [bacterium]
MEARSLGVEKPEARSTQATITIAVLVLVIIGAAGTFGFRSYRYLQATGGIGGGPEVSTVLARSSTPFEITTCLIDRAEIFSGGPPKDGIPALTAPKVVPVAGAKYPEATGLVVGVTIDGEARAYPIGILDWHEAINDTLGGVPIVVTHCPLCRSSLVFRRDVGGHVREFGISGLLYQSNVLLYDRQTDPKEESLWSQALMKAVCGPAAQESLELEVVDSTLTTFADWKQLHPDSTVLSLETGHDRPYRQQAYSSYFGSDQLMFPVKDRTNRRPDLGSKDMALVLLVGDQMKAYPYADLRADADHRIEDRICDVELSLEYEPDTGRVDVTAKDSTGEQVGIRKTYMFWFTYDSNYPNGALYNPQAKPEGQ